VPSHASSPSPAASGAPPAPLPAWAPRLAGKFLVFEGPDGCGKSTQLRRLAEHLRAAGVPVLDVREPGGTDVGEKIRAVLLDKAHDGMALRCEMLLYMASRAELVEKKIRPALARNECVLADRFVCSTLAYQGAAGGLPEADIRAAARIAVGDTWPDLTLVYDCDEETAARRAGIVVPAGPSKSAGRSGAKTASRAKAHAGAPTSTSLFADRMEDRDAAFRRAVRESYLAQAKADPARHLLIDARPAPDEVWAHTLAALGAWAER
jgi:dTMP kinase